VILSVSSQRLLDPVRRDEDIFPYRPAWRSVIVEVTLLLAAAAVVYALIRIVGIRLPEGIITMAGTGIVLLPAMTWLITSVWAERSAPQPRSRLIAVLVITMLAASGISQPFIDSVLQPATWLPQETAVNRIIGYMLSVGITQVFTQYLVLRYTVWAQFIRSRSDAVAYATTAALGYATVLNIQFLIANPSATLDIIAFRAAENLAINYAGALFISLGLAETRLTSSNSFFMPFTVALAALVTGAGQPILAGLVNAPFSIRGVFDRPLLGFGFTAALFFGVVLIVYFLYSASERRERDLYRSREVR
jgi:hypothetical protein